MHYFRLVAASGMCALSACSVSVVDETVSPLSYPSAPVQVRVQSGAGVQNVEAIVPGFGTDAMTSIGNNRYTTNLPIDVCAEIGEFEVKVTTRGIFGNLVDRFPDAGHFTHPVTGLPPFCEDFQREAPQTFTVNRTEDFPDQSPGDGICAGQNDSVSGCSLRAAVMEANARLGPDLIRVPVNRYRLTRTGTEAASGVNDDVGDLDVTDIVTIEGISGTNRKVSDFLTQSFQPTEDLKDDPARNRTFVKVDGNRNDRVFQISGNRTIVRLRNLAVVNGRSQSPGGGILNDGTLVLERVAVVDNQMFGPDTRAVGGGGIRNNGTLVADDVAIAHNQVGGRVSNPIGGALFNAGTATIRRGLIAYNIARFGRAVHNTAGSTIRMENVTIHGHVGSTTSTVVRNEGQMALAFVTFSKNDVAERTLLSNGSPTNRLTLRNVLMVDNTASHCGGGMTTEGGNVTTAPCNMTGSSDARDNDHINVSVSMLGGLDDRGGFTPVYPFSRPGVSSRRFSPIDKGFLPPFPFFDQRGDGFARVVDGDGTDGARPDPGAFEQQN